MDQIFASGAPQPSGLEIAAFVISIVSLVATTVWAVASYFLSGSRVVVRLAVERVVTHTPPEPRDGTMRVTSPRWKIRNWGPSDVPLPRVFFGVVKLVVVVQNRGRIPVDIEQVFIHVPRMLGRRGWFARGAGSVSLPHRLEPGSTAELFSELSSVEEWVKTTMGAEIYRAEVSLGSGHIAKSNWSYSISKRDQARLNKPL